jgi:tetratricopeptide (TPR) repeat protein
MDRAERRRQQRQARRGEATTAPPSAATPPRLRPLPPAEALRLAQAYLRSGRHAEAYALYRRVLDVHPDHAEGLAGCGQAAFHLGRTDDARRLLRRAVAARHDFADAHNNLAVVLQASGELDEALAACQRALRFDPALLSGHINLGNLLRQKGELDEAAGAYQRALALAPEHAGAHYQLGLTLQALERLDAAAASFERAIRVEPRQAEFHYSLGTVLHSMKRLEDALAAYERAIGLKPALLEGLFEVGKPRHIHALFERGEHARALEALDSFLLGRPGQSCALALKAIALDEIGQRARVRSLVDFDHLLRPQRLDPPAEFVGMAEMNGVLADWIRGHPTLREAPSAFSVHHGLSTGELLEEPKGPIRVFERLIRRAVEDYQRSLPSDAAHPFVANMPKRWRLTMWAIVIEAEGFQVPHIHPSGWLSGVYYVTLPEVIHAPDGQRAGWIEFGEPYWDIAHSVQPELKAIQPEEGLLLLFPSYFYHRTLPFTSGQQRISISFDVVPVR